MNYALLLSDQHDPYYNLALEDWLLRHFVKQQPVIFIYSNTPCIVLGRAQNPWKECHVDYCQQNGIDIVRRQSGGGTVYHDLGNLNISFICPITYYDKQLHLDIIVNTLQSLHYPVHKNKRYDVMLHEQDSDYKISGSAFRESKDKAFHHLTLLLNANLSGLSRALHSPLHFVTSKGVNSVRTPVANLNLLEAQFIAALQQQTAAANLSLTSIGIDPHYIAQKQQEYRSWDWCFGKTLAFTIEHQNQHISVNHGIITASQHPEHPVGMRFYAGVSP